MSTKHTPRYLHFIESGDANHYMVVSENKWVMSIQINGELTVEKQREILKELTAAPELLESLKCLLNACEVLQVLPKNSPEMKLARNSIKKATE